MKHRVIKLKKAFSAMLQINSVVYINQHDYYLVYRISSISFLRDLGEMNKGNLTFFTHLIRWHNNHITKKDFFLWIT